MANRLVHALMAAWWVAWVFVVIPCHTRGAIPLGPSVQNNRHVPFFFGNNACCCEKPGKDPAPKCPGTCAICHLTATTPNAPLKPPLIICLHLVEILSPVAPAGRAHYLPVQPYQSRAAGRVMDSIFPELPVIID